MVLILLPAMSVGVLADELTQMIQRDLITLGYDPGDANGDMSTKTIVAISKFQSENNLEVTGEASPQLAGIVKASISKRDNPSALPASASAPAIAATQRSPDELRAAQNACLQERIQAAQASQKKKRGFGSLMRAVTRTATQLGGGSTAADIARTSSDIYSANATAADLESAAKDLGLTEDDVEACRNP